MEKKYRYNVCLSAEDVTTGTIDLTKKEAEIIARATNTDNWNNLEWNSYSGSFWIDIENPLEIKE